MKKADLGGNASSGLGSADHHNIRDMKSMGADDTPTEWDKDTNGKSMFPAPKTLHICHVEISGTGSRHNIFSQFFTLTLLFKFHI